MKVVILAGGYGTRLSEETAVRPKPMVEIGGVPIIWHIMRWYASFGLDEFIVCCGYRGEVIKDYFLNYSLRSADFTVDMAAGDVTVHRPAALDWKVTLVDTGQETMTGGRVRRVRPYLDEAQPFCLTYGDGLSDVPIDRLIDFHRRQALQATLTAVQPPGRFGALTLPADRDRITSFAEKPAGDSSGDEAWVNGGYFVLEPSALDRVEGDGSVWERGPLESLARDGQLAAYRHRGFWQPMDTLRDRTVLEDRWERGDAPWVPTEATEANGTADAGRPARAGG